jgi:hypothetical protein
MGVYFSDVPGLCIFNRGKHKGQGVNYMCTFYGEI